MAFEVQSEHIDPALGHHVVHLHDSATGAHHVIQIIVGHEACALCGHVKVKKNADKLDPKAIVRETQDRLHESHAQVHAYAKKHGLKVKNT